MAHTYSHPFALPATGLRPFAVYGPCGRPDMAMYIFANGISEGLPIRLFNYGRVRRDFTYVDDVVEEIERLIGRPPAQVDSALGTSPDPAKNAAPWRIYNIGSNSTVEVLELLERGLGRKAETEFVPMQPGYVTETYADVDDLMHQVGFRPSTPRAGRQPVRKLVSRISLDLTV